MQEFIKKVNKLTPVLNIRQKKVKDEEILLSSLEKDKKILIQKVKEDKTKYMNGVNLLNQFRRENNWNSVVTIEGLVDFTRDQWIKNYKKSQFVEF